MHTEGAPRSVTLSGSCGTCGEVAGTKVKGSWLNCYKAYVLMFERLLG